jgi:hypothetical protein
VASQLTRAESPTAARLSVRPPTSQPRARNRSGKRTTTINIIMATKQVSPTTPWSARWSHDIPHDNAYYGKCVVGGILSCGTFIILSRLLVQRQDAKHQLMMMPLLFSVHVGFSHPSRSSCHCDPGLTHTLITPLDVVKCNMVRTITVWPMEMRSSSLNS